MGKLILGYWDIHGLGSPVRFLLELIGVDYEEKIYDSSNKESWLKEKESLGLLYPNLPYIIDESDGQTIKLTEHLAIVRYLARKHGLYPQTEQELLIAEQTESFVWDVRIRQAFAAYTEPFEEAKSNWLVTARQKLPYLNNLLAKSEYVTGSKLSYVDVLLYDFMLVLSVFAPEMHTEHPNIARHFKAINSLPQIQNYRNGKGKGVWKERTFHLPNATFKGKI